MELVFFLLPLSFLLATVAVVAFIWATRSGQFDDLETPAQRMLIDEEYEKDVPDDPRT
jgi:cbb3-type cytochrome oxidase maturation protein